MLDKYNPKNSGGIARFALVCLGVGLLVFQAVRVSAQVYTFGGGIDGSAQFTDDGSGNQSFTFTGSQTDYGTIGLGVGMAPPDPTLTINESINNSSSFVWTGYMLNVAMNTTFSIDSAAVSAPPGWSENITQPTGPDGSGNYNGIIEFFVTAGGTPVAIYPAANSTLNLGYQLTFTTAGSFSLMLSGTPVPEPGAFGILLIGGLLLGGRMLVKRGSA